MRFFFCAGALLTLSMSLCAAKAPDAGLLLWMPFDEGAGVSATDCSANRLEADLSNVQWASGTFGTAVRFGGTNAFIDIPSVPGLNGSTQFTLSVWATWEDPDQRRYPNLLTSQTWCPGGLMLFVANKSCIFRLRRPGPRAPTTHPLGDEVYTGLLGPLPQRQWTHLCVTFNLPDIVTYVNGKVVNRLAWHHPLQMDGLRLGGWSDSVCHNGLIDDLRIYSRALPANEVAALAHAPTRASAAYTLAADSKYTRPLAATFKNRWATLTVDTRGQIASLRLNKDGRELLMNTQPLVTAQMKDGRQVAARATTRKGDTLTLAFPDNRGTAIIDVDTHRDFFTFTIRALTLTNAESLTFCALSVTPNTYRGNMANMLSDDANAVCLRGYDLPVEMAVWASNLRVWTTKEYGLTGWRAGLAAGPKSEIPVMLRAMAKHAGVPISKLGGPWSLGAEPNRGSYLLSIGVTHAFTDDWISTALRGGFATIHISEWWQTRGHYGVNTNLFPRGLDDMRDTAQRIHAAGLRAGMHTLTACIDPKDSWVTPVPSPDLLPFDSYTLVRSLSPTDTVCYVNEPPSDRHDTVFTYSGNGNALRIGTELIQYAEVSRTPPYTFAKCVRGAFNTQPSAHTTGSPVDYLQQRYLAFYPRPDSLLADDLAKCIGHVYNTCKLDHIYFDGSEGMMSRYGIDAMRHKIFRRLSGDPQNEASAHGAHNWWFHSRMGAWDSPCWASKRFHDPHIAATKNYRASDLLEPQMGWWSPRQPSPHYRGLFLDENEYFACKNLGLDAAMSMSLFNIGKNPGDLIPHYVEKHITLLGWYERLRLARYFDTQTVARVAIPGDEFELRQDRTGGWLFTPVTMSAHRFSTLQAGSETWNVHNACADQPACARIEAFYSAFPYNSPQRTPLIGAGDFAALKGSVASAAVTLKLAAETADVRGEATNLTLTAENKGRGRDDAWASASLSIPSPYRNIGWIRRAFGLWVKGDGKGAILNLQVRSPREFSNSLSDHTVALDFVGWRYVEFLVREREADFRPQNDLRNYRAVLDLGHVSEITLCLTSLPPGKTVTAIISPVMAMPFQPVPIKNPALTLNGQTLTLPFTLLSGDFAEIGRDGICTHYSEKGSPLARMRSDALPLLRNGDNALSFSCLPVSNASARAEITLNTYGIPFGTPNPHRKIGWKHMEREYEMTRVFLASNDVDMASWDVAVRPEEKAQLEIELCGAMTSPALTINGVTARFPVTLAEGRRLLCLDQRRWTVVDAHRVQVAEGRLDKKIPTLVSGANHVSFTCVTPDRAQVKMVKVYK